MSRRGGRPPGVDRPPVEPAALDRFTRDWYALTGAACHHRALIALSGGPDSTALLLLFAALAPSLNLPAAATVDHGIRAASAQEAGVAADLCRAVGIPHTILAGPLPARVGPTANLSARARALRYELLADHAEQVGARWIVTAHHADDQLETVIMRLNRGSGVGGLAAIRPVSDPVVRPLLNWTRAELAALVAAAGVRTVNDPSNVDARFDRARLRAQLARTDWLDARAASRSAAALADADEAIEWMVDDWERELVQAGEGQALLKLRPMPREVRRRLTERCLKRVEPGLEVRGSDLTRLVGRLENHEPSMLGTVSCGCVLVQDAGVPVIGWLFRAAPPRRAG